MRSLVYEDQTSLKRYDDMRKSGTQLSVGDLTEDVLIELWAGDLASDKQIAAVFNCMAGEVHQLREKYGINHKTCVQAYTKSMIECLGSIGSAIMLA